MEGIMIGALGGIIADVVLFYVYKLAYIKITNGLMMMQLVSPIFVSTYMLALFLGFGILIGVVGSIIALRKFLAV